MTTPKLLPCPFCGGRPIRSQIGESWPTHIVRCSGCGVEILGSDKALLEDRWNNRVVKDCLTTDRAEIERLRAELEDCKRTCGNIYRVNQALIKKYGSVEQVTLQSQGLEGKQ